MSEINASQKLAIASASGASSGVGAPASTPAKIGDTYVDTSTQDFYVAVGTSSSADWILKGSGGGGGGISTVVAGAGLTGGGSSSSVTLNVAANADGSIVVNANDVQVGVLATDGQHGNRGGGGLHADVVAAGASGFMTGADKTKLNGIATSAAALTAVAPVNVTKAAAVVGVATEAARSDHKHDISTAAPGATGVATASADGSASTLARSDHTHQSNTAPANVTKAAAAIGTSGEPARADHKHDITTAAPAATGVSTASADGAASTLARSDHSHQSNTAPVNVTKATAAIGTSGEPARADHKHDITTAAAVAISSANAEGTASSLSRSDHTHAGVATITSPLGSLLFGGTSSARQMEQSFGTTPNLVAIGVGDTADEGTNNTSARIDHQHASVGLATSGTSGFMSASDKTRLDNLYSHLKFSGKHVGGAGATTHYICDQGQASSVTTITTPNNYPMSAGTLLFLRVKCSAMPLATAMTVTVHKNGVATALAVTVTAGSTAVFDNTSDTVTFADNDTMDIVATSNAGGVANVLLAGTVAFVSP